MFWPPALLGEGFLSLQLLAEQLRGLSAGSPEATIGASAKFSTAVRVCHTCLRVCEPLIEYGSNEVVSNDAFKPFWIKVGVWTAGCVCVCANFV